MDLLSRLLLQQIRGDGIAPYHLRQVEVERCPLWMFLTGQEERNERGHIRLLNLSNRKLNILLPNRWRTWHRTFTPLHPEKGLEDQKKLGRLSKLPVRHSHPYPHLNSKAHRLRYRPPSLLDQVTNSPRYTRYRPCLPNSMDYRISSNNMSSCTCCDDHGCRPSRESLPSLHLPFGVI